jgi:hypothetical protein
MFYKNRRAMVAIILSIFAMIFMLFFNSILSLKLHFFNVLDQNIGYVFSLGCCSYALSSILVLKILNYVPARYLTQMALVLATISLFILGPSQLLNLPDELYLILIGFTLAGISLSFIIVSLLYEIILSVSIKEGIDEDH